MAVHLYGVTTSGAPRPEGLKGRRDTAVRYVTDDELAVIVSDVDADSPAGRQDLLDHAHVLEAIVDQATVVPMQFGIALPDDDAVRDQVLGRDREGISELLRALDGFVQLTVQVFHQEEAALREVLRRDPGLADLRQQAQTAPAATAQTVQVELGQAVASAVEELLAEDAAVALDRLDPFAHAVSQNDPAGSYEALNAAFLVERAKRATFDAAVSDLRDETADQWRLRYVGPQPAYSFLEPIRNGELTWD